VISRACFPRPSATPAGAGCLRPEPSPFAGRRAARGGSLFFDPEDQAAADPVGFDEAHQNLLAEPVNPAGTASDPALGSLVADVIIARQGRYRDQPVGAVFPQSHEQPETCDPADVGGEEAA